MPESKRVKVPLHPPFPRIWNWVGRSSGTPRRQQARTQRPQVDTSPSPPSPLYTLLVLLCDTGDVILPLINILLSIRCWIYSICTMYNVMRSDGNSWKIDTFRKENSYSSVFVSRKIYFWYRTCLNVLFKSCRLMKIVRFRTVPIWLLHTACNINHK